MQSALSGLISCNYYSENFSFPPYIVSAAGQFKFQWFAQEHLCKCFKMCPLLYSS